MRVPEMQWMDGERSWSIVEIAYHQLALMSDVKDPTVPPPLPPPSRMQQNNNETYMVCTRRLFQQPFFLAISNGYNYAYDTVKNSNDYVTSLFITMEKSFTHNLNLIQPFTNKIWETFEWPLRNIDNVVCMGLAYLKEKMPAGEIKN